VQKIDRYRTSAIRTNGGQLEALTVVAAPGKVESGIVVSAVFRQASGESLDQDGVVVAKIPALARVGIQARVQWQQSKWVMAAVRVTLNGNA